MPWSQKQHNLFEAAAHDPSVAQRVGIPQQKAQEMAHEGIKRKALVHYLRTPTTNAQRGK